MRLLAGIVLVAGMLGIYAYRHMGDLPRHWHARPREPIVGNAWVIDGDTIKMGGIHIRLEGIDAPEWQQTCTDSRGKTWACGRTATSELSRHIRGQELTCRGRAFDKYNRVVAVCMLPDGSDINAWMVRQGWAVAYGFAGSYAAEETEARAAKRGLWAGTFVRPSRWRHAQSG
jgi:endonuclease YncB( thermonuclease family)